MNSDNREYSIIRIGPLGLLEETVNGKTHILYRGPYAESKKLLQKLQKGENVTIPAQNIRRPAVEFETE